MHYLLWLILGLVALTALLRIEFLLYLAYLLLALYFLGGVWIRRGLQQVTHRRRLIHRCFLGERVPVSVEISNNGPLPIPWLRFTDTLPIELHSPGFFRGIVTLFPNERTRLSYQLQPQRRGYYRIGPMQIGAGDLFGAGLMSLVEKESVADRLIVYPRIVPLRDLGLPSQLPYGSLRSRQRIFEDPTRNAGVRDYQAGDSLRHINWKTSAALGKLQVRRYQPAIAVETALFLNLNEEDYSRTYRLHASELGISIAASIAVHLSESRQAVGLSTNGHDPLAEANRPTSIPPRTGRPHLFAVLDVLARIQTGKERSFVKTLFSRSADLTWGCTVVVITSTETDHLLPALMQLRRRGFSVVLILTDPQVPFDLTKVRAAQIGVPAYRITDWTDLDVWR